MMVRQLADYEQKYPFLKLSDVGRSVLGRFIPAVRIGSGERCIQYNAAFHANEWITTPLLMRFLQSYAEAVDKDAKLGNVQARTLYELVSLWVVPMVNPDGVDLVLHGADPGHPFFDRLMEWNGHKADFSGWKANIRGVDLNDQFPAYWEVERDRRAVAVPGPRDFTGTAPLTEPEAAAMARFTEAGHFDAVFAFHTQGREIYWNYREMEPAESERMAERLGLSCGYAPIKLTGSDAGYKDWFIQRYRKPGFTVEVGFGVNPLPFDRLDEWYAEIEPLCIEGLRIFEKE
jgi:g-D-glutamyl-meso-diaminopimelate peptidase